VVEKDQIQTELYDETEQPLAANAVGENVRRLRRALAGSRYEIVKHPTLGYELIIADHPGATTTVHPEGGNFAGRPKAHRQGKVSVGTNQG
jgi:hypothetical protein